MSTIKTAFGVEDLGCRRVAVIGAGNCPEPASGVVLHLFDAGEVVSPQTAALLPEELLSGWLSRLSAANFCHATLPAHV
ncbi:MAG: hypothetical protein RKE52_13615 [Marinovum algicola]|uniref:hypothetical protein n=1 Tax=Alphaproteobacteria TaxID=28211 RepID=UPI0032F014A4